MKGIKRGLYIIAFIISLFIINTNIKAYEMFTDNNDIIYNEEKVLEEFSKIENYDFNLNNNIFCTNTGYSFVCYSFNDVVKDSISKSGYGFYVPILENVVLYRFTLSFADSSITTNILYQTNARNISINTSKLYTNFDVSFYTEEENINVNVLDFSSYLSPEETPELEINIKATNLLNFLIDKTKNIYEVLINNDIFKFILSIPLIYLVFLVLSRIIKK